MSDRKTDNSTFDKAAYWKSRSEGQRGQGEAVETVKAASDLLQKRTLGNRSQRRQQWMEFRRQEKRGSTRGE